MKTILLIFLLNFISSVSICQLPLFQKQWEQTVDVSNDWVDSSVFTKVQTINNLDKSVLCLTANRYNSSYLKHSLSLIDSSGVLQWQINANYSYSGGIVDFKEKNDTIYVLYKIYNSSSNLSLFKIIKYNLQGQYQNEFTLTGDYFGGSNSLFWNNFSNWYTSTIEVNSNNEILLLISVSRPNGGIPYLNNGQSQITFPNITVNSGSTDVGNNSDVVLLKLNSSGLIINHKIFGQNTGSDYPISLHIDANDRIICGFDFTNLQTIVPSSPQVQGKNVVIFDNQLNYISTIQNVDFSKVGGDNFIYCRTGNILKKYNYLSNLLWNRNYSDFQDFHVNANSELMISGIWIDSIDVNSTIVGDEFPYDYTQSSFDFYHYFFSLYNGSGQLLNKGSFSTAFDIEKPGNNVKIQPYIGNTWLTFSCNKFYFYNDVNPLIGNEEEESNTFVCKIAPFYCSPQVINLGNINSCGVYIRNGQTYTTSGNYSQFFGCDSTIQFQLTIYSTYNPEICSVTADTLSTHNIVIWEKPTSLISIDSFYIYKELTTNQYVHIASIDFDSLSLYHDYSSNPNTTNFKYKIAVKYICGNISQLSLFHNTIHLQHFGSGNFQWTNYSIENTPNPIQSYNFYRDNQGNGNFQLISVIPGNNNSFTDIDFNLYPNAKYRVEATWMNGQSCTPTKSYNSILSNIKNINSANIEEENKMNFNIYPNPAYDYINITTNSPFNSEYKLFDESGRIIKLGNLDGFYSKIDIIDLESGIYFLSIGDIKRYISITKSTN